MPAELLPPRCGRRTLHDQEGVAQDVRILHDAGAQPHAPPRAARAQPQARPHHVAGREAVRGAGIGGVGSGQGVGCIQGQLQGRGGAAGGGRGAPSDLRAWVGGAAGPPTPGRPVQPTWAAASLGGAMIFFSF
jgi:hypothetical protein